MEPGGSSRPDRRCLIGFQVSISRTFICSYTFQEIEKLRRNIWLELNNYLTPLEQIRIVTGILYGYYGLKGTELSYTEVNDFLIHKAIEAKRGNQISNGILYLILCELLDIPVKAIGVPKQFVLAYFKPGYSSLEEDEESVNKIEFYIDPTSGQVFTHKDLESYFKRILCRLRILILSP